VNTIQKNENRKSQNDTCITGEVLTSSDRRKTVNELKGGKSPGKRSYDR
jgi:hypothetical protein